MNDASQQDGGLAAQVDTLQSVVHELIGSVSGLERWRQEVSTDSQTVHPALVNLDRRMKEEIEYWEGRAKDAEAVVEEDRQALVALIESHTTK
mgnify:CR=1 FL=1